MQETFKNTLNLVPNGVLLIDIKSKEITFANKEMEELVNFHGKRPLIGLSGSSSLKELVCRFMMLEYVADQRDI